VLPEIAVFSGDTVRQDEDGFLYFVGRRDEMIKTSGYRVSPTEIEEVVYLTPGVAEAVAFGVKHSKLGQAIVVVATSKAGEPVAPDAVIASCRSSLPLYMMPAKIDIRPGPLPRNVNGKIDRKLLADEFEQLFEKETP
jgi:acyl-CoA synthetase (AMP-forming)/AMP-acid ligase II